MGAAACTKRLAHRDDPRSSREAAELIESSGERGRHCDVVFAVVERHPGLTSAEIAARIREFDLTETRRRLYDLKEDGRITRGEQRRCTIGPKPKRACTWTVAKGDPDPAGAEPATVQGTLFN